ncbi:MAG: thiol-activated cytolysin family protein [Bacteroidales bacterium]|nr:thiol-activated cytolysin family protein [Bacteroidales bacterium]
MRNRILFLFIPIIYVMIFISACKKEEVDSPISTKDVSKYLQELPAWSQFSPPGQAQAPTPKGEPVPLEDVVLDVEEINEDGSITLLEDVTYSCQSQPFTLADNPQQIAMYSPDREILYAGALIQGKSHRDGLGSLLGLPIAERAAIRVSIPGLANDDNFRTVENPSQATVDQAIGSMIGNATASGLATPSSINFKMETYYSEKQSALQMGISGNYLGFEASASGSIDQQRSETTITAQFYQKMYEVVVEAPQSPGDFFSAGFTQAKLEQQISQGRIGPDNLPVYVSNIVYGRMMMFSITSTASESDIRATMQAGYSGIGGSVGANLSAKQESILQESKIKITSIGGDAEATLAMIRSGDWSQYFTNTAPLSSAAPMSYTFRNLGDGSIASVTEATEYNIRSCSATQATPGTFNFLNAQNLSLPVPAPVTVMMGDVNGNGLQDLIYNHVSANSNQTVIAFSNGNGTFTMGTPTSHSASPTHGWSQYVVKVGDFNNDGRDDLAWGRVLTTNHTYIGVSNGDGSFEEMPVFTKGPASVGWGTNYKFEVGNIDGKDGDDLIWNVLIGTNRTYISFSNGDGTFGINNYEPTAGMFQDHPLSAWTGNEAFAVADINGNGRDDLIWYTQGINVHHVYVAESVGDVAGSVLSFKSRFDRGSGGWTNYKVVVGNIDGNAGADMVWVNPLVAESIPVHRDLSTGVTPALEAGSLQWIARAGGPCDWQIRLLDVNGDGRKDLLANSLETVNHVVIGLGKANGDFDFSRISQDHPAGDQWSQFQILTGDINGDSREDVIYVNADATNTVYVGIARGSAQ